MKCIRVGFHKYGKCWRFRFSRTSYFSGDMTWYSFWRLFLVIDKRVEPISPKLFD